MTAAAGARTVARRTALCAAPAALPVLAACGIGGASPAPAQATRPAAITGWLHNNMTYSRWLEPQVDLFRAVTPQVRVTLEPAGTQEKVQAALAGGDPPDFQWANDLQLYVWARQGALDPTEPYLDRRGKADFYDFARSATSYEGKLYGWPWMQNPTGMLVNRDLYEQKGQAALLPRPGEKADWTFEQWKALTRAGSTRAGDPEKDVYGTAYAANNAVYWDMMIPWGNGAEFFDLDERRVLVCSPEGIAGLQLIVDAIKEGLTPPNVESLTTNNMTDLFAEKRLGVFNSSTAALLSLRARVTGGTIVGPYDPIFVPPPHAPGKKPAAFVAVPNMQVFKREKDLDRTRAAQALGFYLTDTAAQKAIKPLGTHPVRRSVGNLYPDDPSQASALSILDNGRGVGRFAGSDEIRALWGPMLRIVYTGRQSPPEGLNELCRLATPILARLRA